MVATANAHEALGCLESSFYEGLWRKTPAHRKRSYGLFLPTGLVSAIL